MREREKPVGKWLQVWKIRKVAAFPVSPPFYLFDCEIDVKWDPHVKISHLI